MVFNDEFLKTGLRIIFEDSQTGEAFDTMETSANSIFDVLDNSEDNDPFNIRLVVPEDYSTGTEKIKMKVPEEDLYDDKVKMNIKTDDDTFDLKMNIPEKEIMWKPSSKITGDNSVDLKMNIPSVELYDNSSMEVNDKNVEKFKLKVNKNEEPFDIKMKVTDGKEDVVNLKMNIGKKDDNVADIKFKIKKEELALNVDENEDLKKLLKEDKPSQLLIDCLNILKDGKKAIDRLIVLVPNDEVLVKTQNIVVELLGRINDDHETLLKAKDKCKELAVNVAKFILDLKSYLKIKFVELKNDVDEASHSDNALDSKIDDIQDNVKKANLDKKKQIDENDKQQTIEGKSKPQMQHMAGNNLGFGSLTKNG